MEFLLCVLGVALFIEGLPWVASPETFKKYLIQLIAMPPSSMRKIGFCMMAGGLALVYLGKL